MSVIKYYEDTDIIRSESWEVNGKLHRIDKPAKITYYENGNIRNEDWYKEGKRHRVNGPANIEYYKNGNKQHEIWYIEGMKYRENGPDYIGYYGNGIKAKEIIKKGDDHNIIVTYDYDPDGTLSSELWGTSPPEDGQGELIPYSLPPDGAQRTVILRVM